MVGSFVSVQSHRGEDSYVMFLCEVAVIGKRLNYGKKTNDFGREKAEL